MNELKVRDIELAAFRARGSRMGATIHVALEGTADMETARLLSAFWSAVHIEAVRLGVRELVIDMRDLEFMSSACFKGLVELLIKAQDLKPSQRYVLRFISDQSKLWQDRSLNALRCFNVHLVVVSQERRRLSSGVERIVSEPPRSSESWSSSKATSTADEKKR